MRKLLLWLIANASGIVWAGSPITVTPLPASEYADTEATTNCPFSLADPDVRHLRLVLDLVASPSNNVEVAFGCDANGDGALALEEIAFAVGWDAGRWIMREGLAIASAVPLQWTASAASETSVKQLRFSLDWNATRARGITATENGRSLAWELPEPLPTWLHDPTWNTMRLAVRGAEEPDGVLWAEAKVDGTTLMIR